MDADKITYDTIKIGVENWLRENLRKKGILTPPPGRF